MPIRTVIQHGPKDKKVAAFAIDWSGWARGAKTPDAAVEMLEAYRDRYAAVAREAGLGTEFEAAGPLEIVEDHVGVGSTDYWGISFAPSSFEQGPMADDELERKLGLLQAAWRIFDAVAARVSPEMQKGPRGGGRDRDQIVSHVLRTERLEFAPRIDLATHPDDRSDLQALRNHRAAYLAVLRDYNAQGKTARRTWTIPFLVRHTAFHTLDHAWEMEDKDLS